MSDRAYFWHHQDINDHFEVHSPVASRLNAMQFIPASRPWLRANGDLAGVVVTALDPAYFARIWMTDDVAQEGSVTLFHRDGTLLMRSPYDEALSGRSFAGRPLFTRYLAMSAAGTGQERSSIDKRNRVFSYRRLSAYPGLVITVSQTLDLVLAAWRRYAAIAAVGWVVASLGLAALALWLRREWLRRAMAEEELSLSRDRLVALLTHTVDGLVAIDEKALVLSFNEPAERIFGYRADEVVGCNVNMLMPEPYHSAHDGYVANYIRTSHAKVIGVGREVQGRHKDGTVFPMDLAVVEIPGVAGGRQFVGTVRDISRQKAMEDQLHQAQKMEAVGQLTGGIAHDFNNLLAVMFGNIEMALDANTSATVALQLDKALRAAERGAELTRRLLAFSRRQTLLPRQVEINRLAIDVVALLRRTLGETIQVETELDPKPLHALVDPGQLENALLNLAVNARDAMPQGGVLSIATSSVVLDEEYARRHDEVAPGAYRMIAVADNGTGMTQEVRKRVFEPFFTTKEVGKGSGLGLSMVYGFVKQSEGHVSISSEPGQGTTISLYLPVSVEQREAELETPVTAEFTLGHDQTILVVEDDDGVRGMVAAMLEKLGFTADDAADARRALEVLDRTEQVDLMITDIVMPNSLSGLDLAAIVRGRRPQMPVIFISGYSSETEALAEIVRLGGILLSKPFSHAQLSEAIQAAMRGYPA